MNGARLICESLGELGISHVFGLPGTQNVLLYEALRTCGLRSISASDEGAAAFMATGYAKASGHVGVLTTIPGPGFVYALAGIVEAQHDSIPLLWLTLRQADNARAFQLQRIDQAAMAKPVVKRCMQVERADELAGALHEAQAEAVAGEPGPVLLEIASGVLEADCPRSESPARAAADAVDVGPLEALLMACTRPVIYAGQGAQGAADEVRRLAARLRAPVLFTSSGRGVLPDTDPLAFVQDFSTGLGSVVPELIDRSDMVLALGCKFTHNGSGGGRLQLPATKLVRIDSSADVLAANYPARLAIRARVEDVLAQLAGVELPRSRWAENELVDWRARLNSENSAPVPHEPVLGDTATGSVREFFGALAAATDGRAIYATDAGLHQVLTRRYAVATLPRGLLCPSDFQSMGFGLPGAIGAAFARPEAYVIACVGDGGLALSAGELLTAVREGIDLVVVVFNDGQLNLIRRQQVTRFGYDSGVKLRNPDYSALAQAVGCSYFPVAGDVQSLVRNIIATHGVRLVELRLGDTPSFHLQQLRSAVRERVRPLAPPGFWQALKGLVVPGPGRARSAARSARGGR
jgi:acetolactate synthase-1/2/3 large subunit